jgi:hypothetical protein
MKDSCKLSSSGILYWTTVLTNIDATSTSISDESRRDKLLAALPEAQIRYATKPQDEPS